MRTFLLLFSLLHFNSVFSDSPAIPRPLVITSFYGQHYFKMIPAKYNYKNSERTIKKPAFGIAYSIDDEGVDKELWRVKGWYSFQTFLSKNGQFLVRMGNWAEGCGTTEEDLGIAFYSNGNLIKQYSTKDLIKNSKNVECTISHYFWRSNKEGSLHLSYYDQFHLKTIEGTEYIFDIETGKILKP